MEKKTALQSILLNRFFLTLFVLMLMIALTTAIGMPVTSTAPGPQPF